MRELATQQTGVVGSIGTMRVGGGGLAAIAWRVSPGQRIDIKSGVSDGRRDSGSVHSGVWVGETGSRLVLLLLLLLLLLVLLLLLLLLFVLWFT